MKKTKYLSLEKPGIEKKTVFITLVCIGGGGSKSDHKQPEDFDNVLWIGNDDSYGDVFKAWNNDNPKTFFLFFGIRGNEFS